MLKPRKRWSRVCAVLIDPNRLVSERDQKMANQLIKMMFKPIPKRSNNLWTIRLKNDASKIWKLNYKTIAQFQIWFWSQLLGWFPQWRLYFCDLFVGASAGVPPGPIGRLLWHPWSDALHLLGELRSRFVPNVKHCKATFRYFVNKYCMAPTIRFQQKHLQQKLLRFQKQHIHRSA